MKWVLAIRGLQFYWRVHIGVLLGTAIGTAVLLGALIVGDSVKHSLKAQSLSRLGNIQFALDSQNRHFRARLANDLETELNTTVAPAFMLRGICIQALRKLEQKDFQALGKLDGTARVNSVQVYGIDERFWKLGEKRLSSSISQALGKLEQRDMGDEAFINERLAEHIGAKEGDDILLRVEKISSLPLDAPMAVDNDSSVAFHVTVKSVIPGSELGNFSLEANQIPPFNVFIPISLLQDKMSLPDRANMLLIDQALEKLDIETANAALQKHWELTDAELELRELADRGVIELRTDRVFLDTVIANAAMRASNNGTGILTYFVNEIRHGNRATPYSIVTAMNDGELQYDEILINTWLAEDIQAKPGDIIELAYFVYGSMRNLEERKSSFRVRSIIPVEVTSVKLWESLSKKTVKLWKSLSKESIDRELMPAFPGISEVENCRDWKPGIPMNLSKIRKKDEEYWSRYRGTPKAIINLGAGQQMWGNRFGNLTAIRYPLNQALGKLEQRSIESIIKRELDPAAIGLYFQPVREQALLSSDQATDFGQLFLGLSLFLIISSSLLTGLLFVFGVQQRAEEMGTLMAAGFLPSHIQRLFLYEGGLIALLGGFLGVGCGILYTKAMLYALSTIWKNAVVSANLQYYAEPATLITGAASGIAISLLSIWATSYKQTRHSARELLTGELEPVKLWKSFSKRKLLRFSSLIALISGISALVILIMAGAGKDTGASGAFFGAGALLLVCGIGLNSTLLSILARQHGSLNPTGGLFLFLRNAARRKWRSLATISLLACGSFLIIAIGANRHDSLKDAEQRWSGTGGFAFYGESAMPVLYDLNSKNGRKFYNLDKATFEKARFIQLRVHEGDDASCLNLNRAHNPRLFGVRPEELQSRGAFTFVKTLLDTGYLMLDQETDTQFVNAIGDQNTVSWSLGMSVGDILPYTDERGQKFNIRIAGTIANSILQGSFLISENEFIKHFPSESGYRAFLIDAPGENKSEISRILTDALQDAGLDLTPAVDRLSAFNAVENTYLSIFQILGGLALLLGSIGLGIVVLRNVMERRNELALMRAVGFQNQSLQWLILCEHWLLLFLGLVSGTAAGLVAVIPALRSPGADVPYVSLIITIFAIMLSGMLWTWLAAKLALRSPLLNALRNE